MDRRKTLATVVHPPDRNEFCVIYTGDGGTMGGMHERIGGQGGKMGRRGQVGKATSQGF